MESLSQYSRKSRDEPYKKKNVKVEPYLSIQPAFEEKRMGKKNIDVRGGFRIKF